MAIGYGSIGEFSVAEQAIQPGIELAVSGAGTIAVVGKVPDMLVGTLISVPTGSIAVVGNVPVLQAGDLIDVPAGTISVVGRVPQILQSSNNLIPVGTINVVGNVPDLGSGALVDSPTRQDSFESLGESIANHSIGEFSLGEGPQELTLSGRRTARLQLLVNAPLIQAGKAIQPPAATIAVFGAIPEIDLRRRRLRSSAICS